MLSNLHVKAFLDRINRICKLSRKIRKSVIKHDLINCCEIGMDFYSLKKGLIQPSNQYFDSLSLVDLSPFPT